METTLSVCQGGFRSRNPRRPLRRIIPRTLRAYWRWRHILFQRFGAGKEFCYLVLYSELNFLDQRYTLDVVGTALLGHDFFALQSSENSFVDHFNRVMSRIAAPTSLIFPFLEKWLPRHEVIEDVIALNALYDDLLRAKRHHLGEDLLSYLLEDSNLTAEELRSNFSILFSAGHVCLCEHFLD